MFLLSSRMTYSSPQIRQDITDKQSEISEAPRSLSPRSLCLVSMLTIVSLTRCDQEELFERQIHSEPNQDRPRRKCCSRKRTEGPAWRSQKFLWLSLNFVASTRRDRGRAHLRTFLVAVVIAGKIEMEDS